ncbi:MAG: hypothetical protein ACKOX5_05420, partial [Bacteroidota bacterium]
MNFPVIFRFGALLGMVSIASLLMTYMIDLTWMVSGWNSLITTPLRHQPERIAALGMGEQPMGVGIVHPGEGHGRQGAGVRLW